MGRCCGLPGCIQRWRSHRCCETEKREKIVQLNEPFSVLITDFCEFILKYNNSCNIFLNKKKGILKCLISFFNMLYVKSSDPLLHLTPHTT